jgi:hypothetical protein
MRTLLLSLAALLLTFALPSPARALDPSADTWEEWRALGEGVVAVRTAVTATAGGPKKTKVTLSQLDKKLATVGDAVVVYDGPGASTALGARDGAAAVALYRGGAQPFVKLALVDLATRAVRLVDLDRTAGPDYAPTAAVLCADPDGFTVLWQEQMRTNPQAEAHSTLARLKPDGTFVAKPAAVPIPWSLGAILDDGRGYTLAVNYDGASADQTRICFVTLTRAGQPEQHPWWGSRPAVVEDVQLARDGGNVLAVYRSGASLLAVPVDKTGQWGKEAAPSKPLVIGVSTGAPFALRALASGVEVVRR